MVCKPPINNQIRNWDSHTCRPVAWLCVCGCVCLFLLDWLWVQWPYANDHKDTWTIDQCVWSLGSFRVTAL